MVRAAVGRRRSRTKPGAGIVRVKAPQGREKSHRSRWVWLQHRALGRAWGRMGLQQPAVHSTQGPLLGHVRVIQDRRCTTAEGRSRHTQE